MTFVYPTHLAKLSPARRDTIFEYNVLRVIGFDRYIRELVVGILTTVRRLFLNVSRLPHSSNLRPTDLIDTFCEVFFAEVLNPNSALVLTMSNLASPTTFAKEPDLSLSFVPVVALAIILADVAILGSTFLHPSSSVAVAFSHRCTAISGIMTMASTGVERSSLAAHTDLFKLLTHVFGPRRLVTSP